MLGWSRALSHERDPPPRTSVPARPIALSGTERSHLCHLRPQSGSLFLQSRRGELACGTGGACFLSPALFSCPPDPPTRGKASSFIFPAVITCRPNFAEGIIPPAKPGWPPPAQSST